MFVGGLSWETTQEALCRYFSRFGEVVDCVVMKNNETGRSRGFGFVTFKDPSCVQVVLAASNGHLLDGRSIDPKACNPRSMQRVRKGDNPKVFLGGLPSNVTETDLRNHFSKYGRVVEVVIMYDQEKKRSRGFGFLSFDSEDSVDRVCGEKFISINSKQVECKKAEPRNGRPPGGSRNNHWNGNAMHSGGGGGGGGPPMGHGMSHQIANGMGGYPPSGWGAPPQVGYPPGGWMHGTQPPYPGPYGSPPGAHYQGWGPHPSSYYGPPGPQYGAPAYGYGYGYGWPPVAGGTPAPVPPPNAGQTAVVPSNGNPSSSASLGTPSAVANGTNGQPSTTKQTDYNSYSSYGYSSNGSYGALSDASQTAATYNNGSSSGSVTSGSVASANNRSSSGISTGSHASSYHPYRRP